MRLLLALSMWAALLPSAPHAWAQTEGHCLLRLSMDGNGSGSAGDADEEGEVTPPGAVLLRNDGDADGDRVPNFADGINRHGQEADQASASFAVLSISVPAHYELERVRVKFNYAASNPQGVRKIDAQPLPIYRAAGGVVRLWRYDGWRARRVEDLNEGGDFLSPNTLYAYNRIADRNTCTLYVEGVNPGDTIVTASISYDGEECSDEVLVTVVGVDLDMDSDHSADFGGPARDELEDWLEDGSWDAVQAYRGLTHVVVNEAYTTFSNGLPGHMDFEGGSPVGPTKAELFTPLAMELSALPAEQTLVRFDYHGADPADLPSPPSGLRLWAKPQSVARNPVDVRLGGDYIPANEWIPLSMVGPLYVEALGPAAELEGERVTLHARVDAWGAFSGEIGSDTVLFTPIQIDLDVDSDNDEGLAVPQCPDNRNDEDYYEDMTNRTGKLIGVNDDDTDQDGLPDFADGYQLDPGDPRDDITTTNEYFAPVVLRLPEALPLARCRIRITYSASDPMAVTRDATGRCRLPDGAARLWTRDGGERHDGRPVHQGGQYIEPGEYAPEELGLSDACRSTVLWFEAVRHSARQADLRLLVQLDPDAERDAPGYLAADAVRFTASGVNMAMDGDRDDTIRFDDPDDRRYLFWVNDDYDVSHYLQAPWEWLRVEDDRDGKPNCEDEVIGHTTEINGKGCLRDLEDFTRLHIRISESIRSLPDVTYHLRIEPTNGTPTVRIFEAVTNSSAYLHDNDTAARQIVAEHVRLVEQTEKEIPRKLIAPNGEITGFLLEGASEGAGDLVLTVRRNGEEIGTARVGIELHDIEWFYNVHKVECTGERWETVVHSTAAMRPNRAGYVPATREKFLLVHGWNMEGASKRRWIQTAFKRLWWQGYQGSVDFFNWPTLDDMGVLDIVSGGRHYDNSEFRAWQSSEALARVMAELNAGGELRVMAHSMGNVVTGEAIRRYAGPPLRAYIACQAAISGHAYDASRKHRLWWPDTLDVLGHFSDGCDSPPHLAGVVDKVGQRHNYRNRKDWALGHWLVNNRLKPDNMPPYDFFYRGPEDRYDSSRSQFYRVVQHARRPTRTLPGRERVIELLDLANLRERYMAFAYIVESRTRALGQENNSLFMGFNLLKAGMGYDDHHYSHSREFRSTIVEQFPFWDSVVKDCQFNRTIPPKE